MTGPQSNDLGSLWISIKDRLPAYADNVLLAAANEGILIGCRSHTDNRGEHWRGPYQINRDSSEVYGVTHWMPLPALPALRESGNAD